MRLEPRLLLTSKADWDRVEELLRASVDEEVFHLVLGMSEPAARRALERARMRGADDDEEKHGTVIFIHGQMGSHLAVPDLQGSPRTVWLDLLRLAQGGLVDDLRFAPREGGSSAVARGLIPYLHATLMLSLGRRWNVHPFLYDWRADIDETARALRDLLDEFRNQRIHLVAHGMGGLVCRSLLRQESSRPPRLSERLGRVVLMGTPSSGTYEAIATLLGVRSDVRWLGVVDLKYDAAEIARAFQSFPAFYQMLPSRGSLGSAARALYGQATWNQGGIRQDLLDRARAFHQNLDREAPLEREKVVAIIGVGTRTRSHVEIEGPGSFHFADSMDGDGLVTAEMARIEGARTYYAEVANADLCSDATVLEALEDILEQGSTVRLTEHSELGSPLVRVLAPQPSVLRSHHSEVRLERLMKNLVREGEGDAAPSARVLRASCLAEEALFRMTLGQEDVAERLLETAIDRTPPSSRFRLRITAVHGDILRVDTPLLVVGNFAGSPPRGLERAVDEALGGWISNAVDHKILGSGLGETFFIPSTNIAPARDGDARDARISARSILLAGKGPSSQFGFDDLRYLMTKVTYAATALGFDELATVIMRPGNEAFSRENALAEMLRGIRDGLVQCGKGPRSDGEPDLHLRLVERDASAFATTAHLLRGAASAEGRENAAGDGERGREGARGRSEARPLPLVIAGIEILPLTCVAIDENGCRDLDCRDLDDASPREWPVERSTTDAEMAAEERSDARDERYGIRLAIEQITSGGNAVFRFSALTSMASIPIRDVERQTYLAQEASRRLITAATREEQEKYGRLLASYLIPEDLQSALAENPPVTLDLDHCTAGFPWEMVCVQGASDRLFLGPDFKLTRRLRSHLSPAPGLPPPLNRRLRVLIIADPADEPRYHLPAARREGYALAGLLSSQKKVLEGGAASACAKGAKGAKGDQSAKDAAAREKGGKDAGCTIPEQGFELEVVAFIGPDQCDPVEILAMLLEEEFDVIHFSGHGIFDREHPSRSGWLFRENCRISARELFCVRRVPRLVFANACSSSAFATGGPFPFTTANREVAGFAEAFMERGVENYIGTGWPVADEPCCTFAREFYECICSGKTIGAAMATARTKILDRGHTWGAFQHYGRADARLVLPLTSDEAAAPSREATKLVALRREEPSAAPATEEPSRRAA